MKSSHAAIAGSRNRQGAREVSQNPTRKKPWKEVQFPLVYVIQMGTSYPEHGPPCMPVVMVRLSQAITMAKTLMLIHGRKLNMSRKEHRDTLSQIWS